MAPWLKQVITLTGFPTRRELYDAWIFLRITPVQAAGLVHGSGLPSLKRPPIAPEKWGRNINRLSVDYAFRLRLRSRLTLR